MTEQRPYLALLVYVEVNSMAEALSEAQKLVQLLPLPPRLLSCHVEPYWKIEEHHGISLHVRSADLTADFMAIREAFAAQWLEFPDLDAVWKFGLHGPAALPSARWAQVQAIWPTPDTDDGT